MLGPEEEEARKKEYLKVITFSIVWALGGIYESNERE
jgi:hypothetical protein